MRSVELFTGAGGLALGLQQAGFEAKLLVERDDDAHATLKANAGNGGPTQGWPITPEPEDVCNVDYRGNQELRDIDLVAGGPPCQPFSIGGKHAGPDDPRDMWPQAIRAVRELEPKAFLFENVRGLAREAFAEYLNYIVQRLRHPGMSARPGEHWEKHAARLKRTPNDRGDGPAYRVEVHKVNAADYGAPQKRHRVLIVGIREDVAEEAQWSFPVPTHSHEALVWEKYVNRDYWHRHQVRMEDRPEPSAADARLARKLTNGFVRPPGRPWVTVRDALAGLPDPESRAAEAIPNHVFQPGARSYAGHTGSPWDEPAKALKAGDHGVPGGENMIAHEDGTVRYFTVRESARLQGFPDNFVFRGAWGETMRQIGNAVPVPMALAVATSIREALERAERARARRAA